jgi:hypothetical protein
MMGVVRPFGRPATADLDLVRVLQGSGISS